MTSDHLFQILGCETDSDLLVQVGALPSIGNVPKSILKAIRLGRITTLCKPDGGEGGDIPCRFVVKTMAKAGVEGGGSSHRSFPGRLATKDGCKCVAFFAVDHGFGPKSHRHFDRRDRGVRSDVQERDARGTPLDAEGDQILPFVRCFCGTSSTDLWGDEMGVTQHIHQGRERTNCSLPSWMTFAVCQPHRVGAIFAIFGTGVATT